MNSEPNGLTIESYARKLRGGEITASALTEQCLHAIDANDKRLNAFVHVMADEARAQAKLADAELAAGTDRGPLHGVPISIKDLIDVRGARTTAASRVREGHRALHDAVVVERLRRAGAVIIGKTNLHEFAFGTTNEESAFGAAHNPHDVSRSPGGSSGGSAISVAAAMALATIGTDTGGSIRIPAAACGIVGLKPTAGEVSVGGVVPLSHTLDHVGPLAKSVADARLVYHALLDDHLAALGAPEAAESTPTSELDARRPVVRPDGGAIRLAVARSYFCDLLDVEVRARFDESLQRLEKRGAVLGERSIPHASEIVAIYTTIVFSDAAAYHALALEKVPQLYSRPVRLRLEAGRYLLAEDLSRALRGREVLRREVDAALEGVDALVLPTLPIPAPPLGAESLLIDNSPQPVRSLMLRETQLFNLTGHPAISIPCGFTAAGLPIGLQLVGWMGRTDALLDIAQACEKALGRGEM